jgi:uncharacterized circularly permuted ATP-grasp superfamily protein/uncharacterized alpha-E superfamily protein
MRRLQPVRRLPHLYFYAADLVRLPSGEWRVYADRTEAPAGLAYALHTRHVLARVCPELFRGTQLRRLDSFVGLWRSSLRALAGAKDQAASIVLLTPGPYNDAYFEHVFLARALGITLAQGADLTVRGNFVYLKTLEGLVRVDVIYRRVDGDYCDSLELREDSALGTAGLVQAARANNVAIVNMPGAAAVQTPAFAPFLPELARQLLGSELQLPAVTTWWCGQSHALAEVRAGLDRFAFHSVFDPTPEPIEPALLPPEERARFEVELGQHPERFVARERMSPSMAPCLVDDADGRSEPQLMPRPVVLRALALWHNGHWLAMPGGVARVVHGNSIYRHVWSHGGIAKDVWVLSQQDEPLGVAPAAAPVRPAHLETGLRSRTVDDLYWLGRYVERLDAGAREFVATLQRFVRGGLSPRDLAELSRLTEALKSTGWVPFAVAAAPVDGAMFLNGVTNAAAEGTVLRVSVDALRRLTRDARDQLSPSMWLALQRITAAASAQFGRGPVGPDALLTSLDATIIALAGFSGFAAETMARGTGWRFLDLGRRIERAVTIAQLVRALASGPPGQLDTGLRLALELCDSNNAFLFGLPTEAQHAQALAFVLAGRANPRSLLYQLRRIEDLLGPHSSPDNAAVNFSNVSRLIRAIEGAVPTSLGDVQSEIPAILDLLDRTVVELAALSDAITRVYFTHLAPSLVLGSRRRPTVAADAAP